MIGRLVFHGSARFGVVVTLRDCSDSVIQEFRSCWKVGKEGSLERICLQVLVRCCLGEDMHQ